MEAAERTAVPEGASGVVLGLEGMSDVRNVKRLYRAAIDALHGAGDVTVDATGIPHLDTAALQVLIGLRTALARSGRGFRIIGVSDGVRAFLRHAGLETTVLG
jgi:anti-anti-sigma factor